jgi:hypothetical protein
MSADSCPTEEQLYAIVAGDGSEAQSAHVTTCGNCQSQLRKLQSEATILRHVGQQSHRGNAETPRSGVPASIGKFIVAGVWDDGPLFATYRGLHAIVHQDVLIQMAKEQQGDASDYLKTFRTARAPWMEARPHVAQVLDVGSHESRPYLVVKFNGGARLDRLADEGELDAATLMRAFGQAAQALASESFPPHPNFRASSVVYEDDGDATIVDWAAAATFGVTTGESPVLAIAPPAHSLAVEFCRAVLDAKSIASGQQTPQSVAELVGRLTARGIPLAPAELVAAAAVLGPEQSPSLGAIAEALLDGESRPLWRRLFQR